uniref:NAC transcription factor 88 n=1 Tax=Litchi chinensis TaxID=151069 RepID=A0A8K1HZF8_LITCN|nr:NAC transcription factor 88 [Litchi chinensis]
MDCETLPTTISAIPTNTTTTTIALALAPGFEFHPTDKELELVRYYLKRKVINKPFCFNIIKKKYGTGARMNRTTGKGHWKAIVEDREIHRQQTNWIMHEYRLVDEEHDKFEAGQEWGNGMGTFPREATGDNLVADNHAYIERNNNAYIETMNNKKTFDSQNKDLLNLNELPTDAQNDLLVCNRDRDDSPSYLSLSTAMDEGKTIQIL